MRMKDVEAVEAAAMAAGCIVPTKDIVQNTNKFLAPMRTRKAATTNQKRLQHQILECNGM
jgi:hypothetical protein